MKKICVIGAGSGIGQALAHYYENTGDEVSTITRDDSDLSDISQVMQLSQQIAEKNYGLVIFSAGVWYHRVFDDLRGQEVSAQIIVNTFAPLQILKWLGKETKFIYLSSIMQHIPAKNMSVYASMKRATSQSLAAIRSEWNSGEILSIDLWAVKTQMHIKAGMKKMVWKDIETVIPKLVKVIETKQWSKTLFCDWWIMIHLVFPLYRIFLKLK